MLKIDSTYMIPERKYFIKTSILDSMPYNTTARFKMYKTNQTTWVSGDPPGGRRFAVFTIPASSRGSAFDWSVNMESIDECYAIAGSSKEQRDAQLGLLGTLPLGQPLPYDIGRLIASYV
jgi:hypothetical protein